MAIFRHNLSSRVCCSCRRLVRPCCVLHLILALLVLPSSPVARYFSLARSLSLFYLPNIDYQLWVAISRRCRRCYLRTTTTAVACDLVRKCSPIAAAVAAGTATAGFNQPTSGNCLVSPGVCSCNSVTLLVAKAS